MQSSFVASNDLNPTLEKFKNTTWMVSKWGNWKAPLIKPTQIKQYALASIWLWRCIGDRQVATRLVEASSLHVNGTCGGDAEFFHSIEMLPLFKLPWRIYGNLKNWNTCNFNMQRCKRWESIKHDVWNLGTSNSLWSHLKHPQTTSPNPAPEELQSPPHLLVSRIHS